MEDDGDDFKFVDEEEEIYRDEQNKVTENVKNVNFEWYENHQVNQREDKNYENDKTTKINNDDIKQIKSNEDFNNTHLHPLDSDSAIEDLRKCDSKIDFEKQDEKYYEEIFNFVEETIETLELNDVIQEKLEFRSETATKVVSLNSSNKYTTEYKDVQRIGDIEHMDKFQENDIGQLEFSSEADITKTIEQQEESQDKRPLEVFETEEQHLEIKQVELVTENQEFVEVKEKSIEIKQKELDVIIEHNKLEEVEAKNQEIVLEELNVKIERVEFAEIEEKHIEIRREESNVQIYKREFVETEENDLEIKQDELDVKLDHDEFNKVEDKNREIKQEDVKIEHRNFNEVDEKNIEIKQKEFDVKLDHDELNEVEEKRLEIKYEELDVKLDHGESIEEKEKIPQLLFRREDKNENLQIYEAETCVKKKILINNKDDILLNERNSNYIQNTMHDNDLRSNLSKQTDIVQVIRTQDLKFTIDEKSTPLSENTDQECILEEIPAVENEKEMEKGCINFKEKIEEEDSFKDAEETSQADDSNHNHKIFNDAIDSKPCQEVVANDECLSIHTNLQIENILPNDDDFEFNEVVEELDANHELQYIVQSEEVKIYPEKNVIENKNNENYPVEDDFDFNEVEEADEAELTVKIPTEINEIVNKNTENNLNEDDFDFNEVDEAEPEVMSNAQIHQNKHSKLANKIEVSERQPERNKDSNEDEDFFDFVKEDDHQTNPQIKDGENIDKYCESSACIQTSQDKSAKIKINEPNQSSIKMSNIIRQPGINSNLISKLLSEYKDSYLSITNFSYNLEKFTKFKDSLSNNEITNFYLDMDENNISMKNFIEVIPSSKFEPEIELKSLTVEEINKLSCSSTDEKKIKVISDKKVKFKNSISEISNTTVKKLYFKYIDLKNIYVNSQLQTHKNIPDRATKNQKLIKKDEAQNNKIDDSEILKGNKKNEDAQDIIHANDRTKDKNNIIEKNNFPVALENLQSSRMMIDITEPSKKDAGELSDEEEFEEVEEEKNKKAIFIDEVLYSIMMDTNLSNAKEISAEIVTINSNAIQDRPDEILQCDSDENKMLEYLKTITLTNKNNKEYETKENLVKEEDENDEIFKKLIDNLPDYNFIISKYVEYPDSLFNI